MEVEGDLHGNIAVCPKIGEYSNDVPCTAYIGYLIPGARVGKGESGTLPGAEGGDDVPSADMTALRQLSCSSVCVGYQRSDTAHAELDIGQTDSTLG